jgi:ribosomal protein S18 acetylase RimI-like enzyme
LGLETIRENIMEYRLGRLEDLEGICDMISSAKKFMMSQGINQWDELYPIKEDFEDDINKNTLYTVSEDGKLVAIYVISEDCDDAYLKCSWEHERPCVIHRLCVSPDFQNRGIGNTILAQIESQLVEMGYESSRLDVFSENPYALKLYEKNGYIKRGHADWRKGRFYLMEKKIV